MGNDSTILTMSWRDFKQAPTATSPFGSESGEWKSAKGQSTVAYDPPSRRKLCIGKDHTCEGFRIKGSKHCAGHDRALKLGRARKAKNKVANSSQAHEVTA